MRYISHLDFIRLIYRALRRAELPYILTKGYNPHPKVRFGQALKLGIAEGKIEVVFFLSKLIPLEEAEQRLQKQLPEGIKILAINYG